MVIHAGGISLSVRNDASFIVAARLSIYEHQSTVCPNMPVRSLIYFSVKMCIRDSHYAIIGMAHVAGDYPLYYDAINEKGLGMAGLNFVGNAEMCIRDR